MSGSNRDDAPAAFTEWLNAREIAKLDLPEIPRSERRARDLLSRSAPIGDGCRRRRGRGWEYHCSCLPGAALAAYERRHHIGTNWTPTAEMAGILSQDWLTTGEIVRLKLPGMPRTAHLLRRFLEERAMPPSASRRRAGPGRHTEYAVRHCLPWEALQAYRLQGHHQSAPDDWLPKKWLSAREIAELALPGMPKHRENVVRKLNAALRDEVWIEWQSRTGSRGGGRLYNYRSLPAVWVSAYLARCRAEVPHA